MLSVDPLGDGLGSSAITVSCAVPVSRHPVHPNALKALRALISTHSSYAMGQGRTAVVTPFTSGASVLTATAGSDAIPGEYEIVVSKLAKAHSQVSGVQASVDGALGKSGEFWLGGTGTASVSFSPAGALSAVEVADVAEASASGQRRV